MAEQGWIKIHRKITKSIVWSDPNLFKLWFLILTKARHESGKVLFNGREQHLNSGQLITGRVALRDEMNEGVKPSLKVNSSFIYRALKKFEDEQMLNINSNAQYSVITVLNWNDYQQSEQHLNSKRTAHEQHLNTNKNEKNDKKNTPSPSKLAEDFEKLWSLYPRKEGKKPAYAAYKRAVTRTKNPATNKQIQDGIVAYKQQLSIDGTDKKFIKQGSTFFNQESWNDYTLMAEEHEKQRPKFDKDEWLMMAYRTNGSVDKVLELIDIDQPPIEKDYAVQFLESVGGDTY